MWVRSEAMEVVGWMWLIVALLKGGPRWGARRRVVEGVAVLRAAKWGGGSGCGSEVGDRWW